MPAMVALFRDIQTDKPCAIHRTFLRNGRKHGKPLMLGPSKGAAIMFSPNHDVSIGLGVGEGIETTLSWFTKGWRPVWAVGGAGNIEGFPLLSGPQCLTVFADNDESGRGQQAARACCERYAAAGIEAVFRMPETIGTDWNDWRAV